MTRPLRDALSLLLSHPTLSDSLSLSALITFVGIIARLRNRLAGSRSTSSAVVRPRTLPLAVTSFIVSALKISSAHVAELWATIGDVVWAVDSMDPDQISISRDLVDVFLEYGAQYQIGTSWCISCSCEYH